MNMTSSHKVANEDPVNVDGSTSENQVEPSFGAGCLWSKFPIGA